MIHSNKSIAIVCAIVLVVLFGYAVAQAITPVPVSSITPTVFVRDLRVGSTGTDVLELQKILNKDVTTRVAEYGVGSPGNETSYFGEKTRNAVIRFQNKYAIDILIPQGLSSGNGLVDIWTRLKLNMLSLSYSSGEQNTDTGEVISDNQLPTVSLNLPENKDKLTLSYISEYFGPVGTKITLTGTGFSMNENTILFDDLGIKAAAISSDTLTFKVPTSMPPGKYDVWVKNKKGKTKEKTFFVVTKPNVKAPIITSVTPTEVKFGDTITVTGENFTATKNEIRSAVGIFSDLKSSDGKTIKFKLTEPDGLEGQSSDVGKEVSWPVDLYIINGNGVNSRDNPGKFTIKQ